MALNGANTVQSDDLGPGAQVLAPDIGSNAVHSADVGNESRTGADVRNQSGVTCCTHGTVRFGELWVGVANVANGWQSAQNLCVNLELRLPSLGEARSLARNYDLPNVGEDEFFWTEEFWINDTEPSAMAVTDGSGWGPRPYGQANETVCVTTPTN